MGTSGIPDYTMFLWNVETYELVCSTEIGTGMKVKGAAFDPQNSNLVSLITDKGELFLYKIEKCGSVCSKFTRIIIGKLYVAKSVCYTYGLKPCTEQAV